MNNIIYTITIYTGDEHHSSSFHDVFFTLVGTDGQSEPKNLQTPWRWCTSVLEFEVECPKSLGKICVIILKRKKVWYYKGDWFVAKVEVKSPIGDIYHFPIYTWITDYEDHYFQEGSAKFFSEEKHPVELCCWIKDITEQQTLYRWDQYKPGLPFSMKAESYKSLPYDVQFSPGKELNMLYTEAEAIAELKLSEWVLHKEKWTSVSDIEYLYNCHHTKTSDYVFDHWKEDWFFGYQFLNGVNPMLIQRCEFLPNNFPVTDEMVFQDKNYLLTNEIKEGNIFLCDYKMLDGVKANVIDGKQQYLAAPLVLLHKTPENKLMPIAIQLKQTPGEDNPVFLPTDTEWDWLLAKTFVRNADFNLHELNSHLLRTHLLAEVFTVALLRQLPMMHPVYKLLMPHTRYTLMINSLAREYLISDGGVFTKFASSGGEGMLTILQRALSSMTYRSLCLPEDICDRGLDHVPNFYYREDGLKLWNIIYSFVTGTLGNYYKNDNMVQQDHALQHWIWEIYSRGFLENKNSGIPMSFTSVDEVFKFVTMVIFTCSAQHSAVNTGQYDFIGWMPNTPVSLERPPPSRKGEATEDTLLETFPSIDTTVQGMAAVWLLSMRSKDSVLLGDYPEEQFIEHAPLEKIKEFKENLNKLSHEIQVRNKDLDLPYTYLDPELVENSISV